MTLEELKKIDDVMISPQVAASVMHCNVQYLRKVARDTPEKLGFPVLPVGKVSVSIPRLPFIKFLEG